MTLLCLRCMADGPYIAGNLFPAPGATETYTSNWDQWDNTYETYANVSWDVVGGTVLGQDKHTITIQWNYTENNLDITGSIHVIEDLGGQETTQSVLVLDNSPGGSETCSGILGAAKVAVTFGAGPNPGPNINAFGSTTYNYVTTCAIDVNQYTLTNSEPACRSGWWNIPHDHTGDPNGYMMMVNGNASRGEFFRTTVSGLNPGYTYEFSVWVGNLFDNTSGGDPLLRFQVYDMNGNELLSSGSIDVPPTNPFAWQKIGYMVNLPAGVTQVQIVLVDLSSASYGNDIVLDDISFAPCFPNVNVLASFSPTDDVPKAYACNSGTVHLYGSFLPGTTPFTNPSYQWERSTDQGSNWSAIPNANSLTATVTENSPGIYMYRLHAWESATPSYQAYSAVLTYFVQQISVTATTYDLYSCTGGWVSQDLPLWFKMLYSDPNGPQLNYTYNWQPINGTPAGLIGNTTINSPYFSVNTPAPPDNGPAPIINYYYFSATVTSSDYGCSASGVQTVAIHEPRKVYVPNAFTPDGQTNKLFRPINITDYPGSLFQVYDRWGELVFSSTGPTLADYSWNGTFNGQPQPIDTYSWVVQMQGCPGRIYSSTLGDGYPYGNVELIR